MCVCVYLYIYVHTHAAPGAASSSLNFPANVPQKSSEGTYRAYASLRVTHTTTVAKNVYYYSLEAHRLSFAPHRQ